MRRKPAAKKHSGTKVVHTEWDVVNVRPLPGHRLFVEFADGTKGEVDCNPLVFGSNPGVFERLRDPKEFAQVGIEHGAVTWPSGLDLAPDAMYDEIRATGKRIAGRS